MTHPARTAAPNRGRSGVYDDPELLRQIITVVTSTLDLAELVQGVADVIVAASRTDACFVHLLEVERGGLVLSGASPPLVDAVGRIRLAIGEGVTGWVAARGQPVVILDDKTSDPRYKYFPELRGEDYTSMASVPMVTTRGSLIGVLNVHTRDRRDWLAADVEVLTAVGGLMAGAVENARLHTAAAQRSIERARFAEQLVEAQERERERIARDLHDGVSQRLASLGFHLSAALESLGDGESSATVEIDKARSLSVSALDEARAAITGLRPPVLDDLGLAAALHSLSATMPGVDVVVQADTDVDIPRHVETCIFRVTQEALQNISKHAEAAHAWISLGRRGDRLVLEVADNGVGVHSGVSSRSAHDSYGMQSMRERAEMVGGTVRFRTRSGGGTVVQLTLPLRSLA